VNFINCLSFDSRIFFINGMIYHKSPPSKRVSLFSFINFSLFKLGFQMWAGVLIRVGAVNQDFTVLFVVRSAA
jgi:hypothetical protein